MRVYCLALALVLMPAAVSAQEPLDRLPELVEAGRMEAAYELASDYVDDKAGEPRFDLYYGIAAIDTGRVDEGIFALERVLLQRPGLDRARLELARGYFLQEEDRKAREQFEIVLSHDPPPGVVDRIQRYLAAIQRRADRYQATVTGHAQIAGGYDSNVNRVSEQTTTVELLPGFPLEVGAQSDPREDAFLEGSGRLDLSYPLVPGFNLVGGVRANVRGHQDETQFDRKRAGGRFGARYTSGPHRITSYLQGSRFYVGSEPYQRAGGITASYRYTVSDATSVNGLAQATQQRYDEQEQRDSTVGLIGAGVRTAWSGAWLRPSVGFTALVGGEFAEEDTQAALSQAERDIGRLRSQVVLSPASQWTVRTALNVEASRYDSAGPIVPPEAREEETYTLNLDVEWRPSVSWQITPFLSYSQRESNVAIYEFDRTAGGLRVRYSFY